VVKPLFQRVISAVLFITLVWVVGCTEVERTAPPTTITIFHNNVIHFAPDDSSKYETAMVTSLDAGRIITTTMEMQRPSYPVQITARVTVKPTVKDIRNVWDRWDRAGNVRLRKPGQADIEILKFVTAYGGRTVHEMDVSHLASLLDGSCTFLGFIDTWVSPAWQMDFELVYEQVLRNQAPQWVAGLVYDESMTRQRLVDGPQTIRVDIPDGTHRVLMHYLVSGHCTDGIDADEFQTKDNVITVDGHEVFRLRPWRDDCLQFRAINPYCARWSDGSWSSDYSRSGWCPGDVVLPVVVDLSEYLTPGRHSIGFLIEDIRPEDEDGHFGYWRVSSHLLGWEN
jgi:hypothetical protein